MFEDGQRGSGECIGREERVIRGVHAGWRREEASKQDHVAAIGSALDSGFVIYVRT